ncbi:hypothetical protein BH10PSE12_BH10PSE12_17540 [soil metagenome]
MLTELLRVVDLVKSDRAAVMVGRIVAHLAVLRRPFQSVAGMLERGVDSALQAAIVKDLGVMVEREITESHDSWSRSSLRSALRKNLRQRSP